MKKQDDLFKKYPPARDIPEDAPDDFMRVDDDGQMRRYLRCFGEFRHLSAWAAIYGMTKFTLCLRLKNGMSIEKAITTPLRLTSVRARVQKLRAQAERNVIVDVREDGAVKKIFRREKLSPENLKAVKQAAVEAKKALTGLGVPEMLKVLEKEFGEKKYVAWNRLKREKRYQQFRTVCSLYRRALHKMNIGKHIIFYLALEHFPRDEYGDL